MATARISSYHLDLNFVNFGASSPLSVLPINEAIAIVYAKPISDTIPDGLKSRL